MGYSLKSCGKRHGVCKVCRPGFYKARPDELSRTARHKALRKLNKDKALALLGNLCRRCGYDKCKGALVFHHPGGKDFGFAQAWTKGWEALKAELQRCELLCANCHHEEHCEN